MRKVNFNEEYKKLLTPYIVDLLTAIHEYRGKQNVMTEVQTDRLEQLMDIAKIQSTEASNRIEGIVTTDDRLKKLLKDKTTPRTRNEKEIAGYRDVLSTIHNDYDYIAVRPSVLLQLHRDLYKFSGAGYGGIYKSSDNVIAEDLADGSQRVRFVPIAAWETPEAVEELCNAYEAAFKLGTIDSLLLIPMFVLDFLCIHPFNDGNGRMSRLLTLLLMYKTGYYVGKYISIEKIISDSKQTYYDALEESSLNWHECKNDYEPIVRYLLGVILAAYREFDSRISILSQKGMTKSEQIRSVLSRHVGRITKAEIMEACPDISSITVQRTLSELINSGDLIKISGGRYTAYVWNGGEK